MTFITGTDVFRSLVITYLLMSVGLVAGVYLSRVESGALVGVRNLVDEIDLFFRGHPEERTSPLEKVIAEISGQPRVDRPVTNTQLDLDADLALRFGEDMELRASAPLPADLAMAMFVPGVPEGHLIIVSGASDRIWLRPFPNAVDFFLNEREVLFLSPRSLSAVPLCEPAPVWTTSGLFHHYFSPSEEVVAALGTPLEPETVARLSAQDESRIFSDANHMITLLDRSTGDVLRSFDFYDIAAANIKRFDPLAIEKAAHRREWVPGVKVASNDFFHPNDVELYPDGFPEGRFVSGDLLVSSKGYNLVFVVNTASLAIKWVSQGQFQGQHDPDWFAPNQITVFNNRSEENPTAAYSSVDLLDMETGQRVELASGAAFGGVTRHSGGHAGLNDWVLMSLSLQSKQVLQRAGDPQSRIEWTLSQDGKLIGVQEAKLLPAKQIERALYGCDQWQVQPRLASTK